MPWLLQQTAARLVLAVRLLIFIVRPPFLCVRVDISPQRALGLQRTITCSVHFRTRDGQVDMPPDCEEPTVVAHHPSRGEGSQTASELPDDAECRRLGRLLSMSGVRGGH